LQKNLPDDVFKTTKIFEKAEIRWVCADDLPRMKPKFRSYFQNIVTMMMQQKDAIKKFVQKDRKKGTEKKALGKGRKTRRLI